MASTSSSPSSSQPLIVVVGAGCVGLGVGIQLLQRGYRNVIILTKSTTPNTASDWAGALWRPFGEICAKNTAFQRWGKETFNFLNDQRTTYGSIRTGICLVSGFEVFETEQPTPFWVNEVVGFRMMDEKAIKEAGINTGHKHGFFYSSLVVDMAIYMNWLHRMFTKLGGRIQLAELQSLSEVQKLYPNVKAIINCSGLGARTLVPDPNVFPVAGQIVKVRCPSVHHFYMDSLLPSYIFPRLNDIVIGGSYDKHSEDLRPNIGTRNDILNRAIKFLPELEDAKIVGEYVGLRPYRQVTRLELEMPQTNAHSNDTATQQQAATLNDKVANKPSSDDVDLLPVPSSNCRVPVIHNYGHGGSGVTLHWGCGIDVCKIIDSILPLPVDQTPIQNHSSSSATKLPSKM